MTVQQKKQNEKTKTISSKMTTTNKKQRLVINFKCFLIRQLTTIKLNQLAKQNKLRDTSAGTHLADVNAKIKSTCCWIWNTDKQNKDGQHWVAFYKRRKNIFFL